MKPEKDPTIIKEAEIYLNTTAKVVEDGVALFGDDKAQFVALYNVKEGKAEVVELHRFENKQEISEWYIQQQDRANEEEGVPYRVRNKETLDHVQKDFKGKKIKGNCAVMLDYDDYRFLAVVSKQPFSIKLEALFEMRTDEEHDFWMEILDRGDEDIFERLRVTF